MCKIMMRYSITITGGISDNVYSDDKICYYPCNLTHIRTIRAIGSYFLHPISLPGLRIINLLSFPLYLDPSSPSERSDND